MERIRLKTVSNYSGVTFIEVAKVCFSVSSLMGLRKDEIVPSFLFGSWKLFGTRYNRYENDYGGGGGHQEIYFSVAGKYYVLASKDVELKHCSSLEEIKTIPEVNQSLTGEVFLNQREMKTLVQKWPELQEFPSFVEDINLLQRKRQIQAALTKCSHPEIIEGIGRLLGI